MGSTPFLQEAWSQFGLVQSHRLSQLPTLKRESFGMKNAKQKQLLVDPCCELLGAPYWAPLMSAFPEGNTPKSWPWFPEKNPSIYWLTCHPRRSKARFPTKAFSKSLRCTETSQGCCTVPSAKVHSAVSSMKSEDTSVISTWGWVKNAK